MRVRRVRALAAFGLAGLMISGAAFAVRTGQPADAADSSSAAGFPSTREAQQWPFAWDSIWNLPIGEDATIVPAGLPPAREWGLSADENVLVLEPDAPRTNIALNTAGWSPQATRCGTVQGGNVIAQGVPIPTDFSTDPGYMGRTPNMAAALLLADGATVMQTQPFHRCGEGGAATSQYVFQQDNLKTGNGINGAHGGSGMSSLGGTLRLDELVPGGAVRHALKIELDCTRLCYYRGDEADGRAGFRWPANNADRDAGGRYGGSNPAVQMGSLLALPGGFDESQLSTEPARMMARALKDYGAYVVDDTGWQTYAFATEWSPDGRMTDQFDQAWGFAFDQSERPGCSSGSAGCQWANDMATLISALGVVDDNGPGSIGGAGARRAPCAPAFSDGTGGAPADCGPTTAAVGTTDGSAGGGGGAGGGGAGGEVPTTIGPPPNDGGPALQEAPLAPATVTPTTTATAEGAETAEDAADGAAGATSTTWEFELHQGVSPIPAPTPSAEPAAPAVAAPSPTTTTTPTTLTSAAPTATSGPETTPTSAGLSAAGGEPAVVDVEAEAPATTPPPGPAPSAAAPTAESHGGTAFATAQYRWHHVVSLIQWIRHWWQQELHAFGRP